MLRKLTAPHKNDINSTPVWQTAVILECKETADVQAHASHGRVQPETDLRTTTLKGCNCWPVALGPASASAKGGMGGPKRWGWGQARMRVSMALVRGEVTHKASSGILCSASLLRSRDACTLAPHFCFHPWSNLSNVSYWHDVSVHALVWTDEQSCKPRHSPKCLQKCGIVCHCLVSMLS